LQEMIVLTDHAKKRISSRGLDTTDIHYVLKHGARYIAAGVIHVFLGKRHIPIEDLKQDCFRRLEGTTVLLSSQDRWTVITVYRNRNARKKDRCKAKYTKRTSTSHARIVP